MAVLGHREEIAADIADRALVAPEGITVTFSTEAFKGLDAARVAAKRLQGAFNTMRLRERRRIQKQKGEHYKTMDSECYGKYDALACLVSPCPVGYTVRFLRKHMIDVGITVTDNATGEELIEFSPIGKLLAVLNQIMSDEDLAAGREGRKKRNPYTPVQLAFLRKHEPNAIPFYTEAFGIDFGEEADSDAA